jgi:hypothetical protein
MEAYEDSSGTLQFTDLTEGTQSYGAFFGNNKSATISFCQFGKDNRAS